jgi:hypothetical protein
MSNLSGRGFAFGPRSATAPLTGPTEPGRSREIESRRRGPRLGQRAVPGRLPVVGGRELKWSRSRVPAGSAAIDQVSFANRFTRDRQIPRAPGPASRPSFFSHECPLVCHPGDTPVRSGRNQPARSGVLGSQFRSQAASRPRTDLAGQRERSGAGEIGGKDELAPT